MNLSGPNQKRARRYKNQVRGKAARFFFAQKSKLGKKYQMTRKYTNWK
jgi:hypothetical protein